MTFSYLASPYSHYDKEIEAYRYTLALRATRWLISKRHWCYSPIVHCHDMSLQHDLPGDHIFWRDFNEAMISASKGIVVLTIDGWKESKGIAHELEYAKALKLPVAYMQPIEAHYRLKESP